MPHGANPYLLIACALWCTACDPELPSEADRSAPSIGDTETTGSSTQDHDGCDSTCGQPGDVPIAGACSPYETDCPAGEKCNGFAEVGDELNAVACFPLACDPVGPGSPCQVDGGPATGLDDCDATSMCFDVDPTTNTGVCRAFCTGAPDSHSCQDPSTQCVTIGGAVDLCLEACDPLLQNCPGGSACRAVDGEFVCTFSANVGDYGDPCVAFDDCAAGLFCGRRSAVPGCAARNCCTSFCDLGNANPSEACPDAAAGQVCAPWYRSPNQTPPGFEDVGRCTVVP